ncbi:MAG: hypothetical protein GY755_19610 [Chloroflexi bacterium]|nr:hypothetical protein [Chloroflexota bacterium]
MKNRIKREINLVATNQLFRGVNPVSFTPRISLGTALKPKSSTMRFYIRQ